MTTTERILQRNDPCRCGCGGRDPWHAKYLKRAVGNIRELSAPVEVSPQYSEFGYRPTINAIGTFKHPDGVRYCGRQVSDDGYVFGWVAIDIETTVAKALVAAFRVLHAQYLRSNLKALLLGGVDCSTTPKGP